MYRNIRKDTRRIIGGGGLRASDMGEMAIGRAAVLLKAFDTLVCIHPA